MERITIDPAICHGKPTVRGTRYFVSFLLELMASGMTMEEILEDYPKLTREDLLACLAYAAKLSTVKRIRCLSQQEIFRTQYYLRYLDNVYL